MKFPNYRYIAPYYDFLARLMFGDALEQAKRNHLHLIQENNRVLIVGGGTGKVIEYIDKMGKPVKVDFIEPTENMITRAKKRRFRNIDVNFTQRPILAFDGGEYDIIITNFFLDQFLEDEATAIVNHLGTMLNLTGKIIFSDFIRTNYLLDQLFEKVMYFFFGLLTRSPTRTYPAYDKIFKSSGFIKVTSQRIGRNIETMLYANC